MASFLSTHLKTKEERSSDPLLFWRRYPFEKRGARSAPGSKLKAKRKRLSIVFATLFAAKQGVCRAECTEETADDYATGESCRLIF